MSEHNSRYNSEALRKGKWVKLICGASNQDLPSIADLCAIYATIGVHCIDLAADAAVIHAAREALDWVHIQSGKKPWIMVSLSDGEDAHFRKAWFDPAKCPINCSRPCQRICPAKAISSYGGINEKRCYGCGRCISTCPLGLITEEDRRLTLKEFLPLLKKLKPDAVEIHTAPGRSKAFEQTIKEITSNDLPLKRLSVSCGLEGYGISAEQLAQELWLRYQSLRKHGHKPLWQLDGRKMSGDLGLGAAKVAVALWKKIRPLAPPGPLQLAGGTNESTIKQIPKGHGPEGIAFGGMARQIIQPWLLEAQTRQISLREWPEGWQAALSAANELISPWLSRDSSYPVNDPKKGHTKFVMTN